MAKKKKAEVKVILSPDDLAEFLNEISQTEEDQQKKQSARNAIGIPLLPQDLEVLLELAEETATKRKKGSSKSAASKLATLKEKMQTAKNFSEVWNYFFDHIEEIDDSDDGAPVRDDFLEEIINKIGEQILGEEVVVTNLLLIKLAKYNFYHGGFFVNGCLATLFFFRDIDMGMMSMVKNWQTSETVFSRITTSKVLGTSEPIIYHPKRATGH